MCFNRREWYHECVWCAPGSPISNKAGAFRDPLSVPVPGDEAAAAKSLRPLRSTGSAAAIPQSMQAPLRHREQRARPASAGARLRDAGADRLRRVSVVGESADREEVSFPVELPSPREHAALMHACRLCKLEYPPEALAYRATWTMLHETMTRVRGRVAPARLSGLSFALRPDILDPVGGAKVHPRAPSEGDRVRSDDASAPPALTSTDARLYDDNGGGADTAAMAATRWSRKYQVPPPPGAQVHMRSSTKTPRADAQHLRIVPQNGFSGAGPAAGRGRVQSRPARTSACERD